MTTPMPWRRPTLVALFSLTFALGCESETAKERAAVQVELQNASSQLRLAALRRPSPESKAFGDLQTDLNGIVSKLSSVRGGVSGQEAAKSLLMSSALMHLGAMDLTRTRVLERQTSHQCNRVGLIIKGGADLASLMQSHESVDLSVSRSLLERDRSDFEAKLSELNDLRSELEGPIGDRLSQNESDAAEAEQLRRRSDELFREANESGYTAGFPAYEQAVLTRRQADRVDLDIAHREIELDLNLQAEHNYISLNASHASDTIDAIDAADTALDDYLVAESQASDSARRMVQTLGDQLDDVITEIEQRMEQSLLPVYDSAREHLERAATEARNAASKVGRGGNAGAMHMAVARAQEALGELHWGRAHGIAALRDVYQGMIEASTVFDADRAYDRYDELDAAYDAEIEEAKAAFNEAKSALSQAGGGDAQALTMAFQQGLDMSLAALDGADVSGMMQPDQSAPEAASDDANSMSDGGAMGSGGLSSEATGFPTPEALMAHLKASAQAGDIVAIMDAMRITDPQAQREADAVRDLLAALDRLEASVQSSLGNEAQQVSAMLGPIKSGLATGFAGLANATEVSRTDDRISHVVNMNGQSDELDFILVDGQWVIDGDDPTEDSDQQMQRVTAMSTAFNSLADRLDSGEITSAQQMQAIMGQLMSGMQ